MPIKTDLHIIKGMQRDISVSKANAEFAFDALNIRLTAREGNTLLSVTNEKGNKEVPIYDLDNPVIIEGIVIGKEIINNYLVLFTTSKDKTINKDRIYRLEKKLDKFDCVELYKGDLNFDFEHPIESIGIFENEDIQKVYWVDGLNPVRFINITKTYNDNDNDIFNFVQDLSLDEVVTIKSNIETQGSFPSGTVQYVFTHYNKHGAETNIFYHSPLYYSYSNNRGGSPEELGSNSFDISVMRADKKFDYIRVYSIVRTSIDAVPTVRRVVDLNPENTGFVYFTDTNTTGENVDPTLLLYLGGENVIPECITHKDNTLFLGNYKLKDEVFPEEIKERLTNEEDSLYSPIAFEYKEVVPYEIREGQYDYSTQLNQNSYEITTLKARETYRFGIQFQNKIGRWSEVLWVGDYKVDKEPEVQVANSIEDIGKLMGNKLIRGIYTIPEELVTKAAELGYKKARGVIVYPSESDRDIICQGVLNPTVYKADDRETNSPYAQSSWFFRPYIKENSILPGLSEYYKGSVAIFTDKASLGGLSIDLTELTSINRSTEIGSVLSYTNKEGKTIDREFYVDANIVTIHSPDIEFQDNIINYEKTTLNCNIVGYINVDACKSFRDVQASTPPASISDYGFYSKFPSNLNYVFLDSSSNASGRMLISGINWMGGAIKASGDGWISTGNSYGWLVYPWQRSGSLINDFAKRPNDQVVSKLKYNRMINTRVSYTTVFGTNWIPPKGISNITVFDSNESVLNYIGNTGYSYYGNIDKVLIPGSKTYGTGSRIGYTKNYNNEIYDSSIDALYSSTVIPFDGDSSVDNNDYIYSKDPISMKYKSSKHAVFAFNEVAGSRVLLPALSNYGEVIRVHTFDSSAIYDKFDISHNAILWLAELTREIPSYIKFGGNTKEALINNKWHIAGDSVHIAHDDGTIFNNIKISYLQGDTYLQRYDCLKTYPYTLEDENNVTEILSFFCETRTNIDGRYDRNRANFNNLALSPNNFNLLNPVYSQKNNFFNYFVLDESLKINNFNNSITWSKEKSLGEDIDQWTNITLASTLELDGDKGEITALKTFNNEIFCFQKQGISNILFNSRVQIPTSDGVPIEITNGLKVQGKRYLSSIGCSNKWSIAESPVGLYFIDSNTDEIYLFNGQITSLSTQLGFSSYAKEHNHLNKWNPITFDNFRTHYDKSNGDVYFTDKTSCLVYSESLGQFTSFMSYEETPYMFNIDNSFYAIKNNKIWEQFAGDYNSFYGKTKPYSITIISNPDSFYDKVFNTVEFRADTWDNNALLNNVTFDTLEVWNEYQHGRANLTNILGKPSPLKRKFRVWRTNIPRDISNNRDRIRNTWAYVKLEHSNPSNYKTEFHDLIVHYFV